MGITELVGVYGIREPYIHVAVMFTNHCREGGIARLIVMSELTW